MSAIKDHAFRPPRSRMSKVNLQYLRQLQPRVGFLVDAALFRVLFAIYETGSQAGAACAVDMSYRHV